MIELNIDKDFLYNELILNGRTKKELAERLNCSVFILDRYLNQYNIKTLKKWEYINNNYSSEIIKMYNNKQTLNEIAQYYNVHKDTIKRVLINNNITIRDFTEVKFLRDRNKNNKNINGRIFTLNENYFDTWSHNMSYILGFIYADGCIKGTQLIIELNNTDQYLLNEIKKELEYTGDIKNREKTNSSRLAIRSCFLTDSLKQLGVMENKSHNIRLPNISGEYISDFLRGYFDGDGTVGIHMKNQIRTRFTCGNKLFLEDIVDLLYDKFNISKVKISKDKRSKSTYDICYSTKSSKQIFNILYKDINYLKCSRKYSKFLECIKNNK